MDSLDGLEISRAHPARAIHFRQGADALVLRPTLISDAEAITAAATASLAELKRFMPWAHSPPTARDQLERLRKCEADYFSGRELVMGLFREGEPDLLTMVGLHPRVPLNPRALEIGYWAPTPHAGQGWTTLAVRVALIYAFDTLGADRVQVLCDEANLKSRRVIDKCGFALEGVLRNVIQAPTPELVRGGYEWTGRSPMFGLFPDTFEALPWVLELRNRLTYENLAGHRVATHRA
jgi:RimJ/RimL family protein N-acetyltransferase